MIVKRQVSNLFGWEVRQPVIRGLLDGSRLVWRAARSEACLTLGLQLAVAGLVTAELLLGQQLLARLVAHPATAAGAALPALVGLIGATMLVGFIAATQQGRDDVMRLRMEAYAVDELAHAVGEADLVSFDVPGFNDRLYQAKLAGTGQSLTVVSGLSTVLSAGASAFGVVIALGLMQPVLIPLLAALAVPLLVAAARNGRSYYSFTAATTTTERMRAYLAHTMTTREHAAELRSLGLVSFLRGRYRGLSNERLVELRRNRRERGRRAAAAQLVSGVLTIAATGAVAAMYAAHLLSVSQLAVAGAAMIQLRMRFDSLSLGTGQIQEAALFIRDNRALVKELLTTAASQPVAHVPHFAEVSLERVSFNYPDADRNALSDISLAVRAGELIALIGANGSGKTTLARIIGQLHQPSVGHVRWNTTDATVYDPRSLRQQIAFLSQDFGKYRLTAGENIAIGSILQSEHHARIHHAAECAGAAPFINALGGYQILLAQDFPGGHDLSVGQWQRIALARVILRDAPLLILDEPTAALDAAAEDQFFNAMRPWFADKAVLLISHRMAAVRHADRIYVLDDGRVIEQGTHEQLIQHDGEYRRLYSLQASAYADPDGPGAAEAAPQDRGLWVK